jgi:hypothetical protein
VLFWEIADQIDEKISWIREWIRSSLGLQDFEFRNLQRVEVFRDRCCSGGVASSVHAAVKAVELRLIRWRNVVVHAASNSLICTNESTYGRGAGRPVSSPTRSVKTTLTALFRFEPVTCTAWPYRSPIAATTVAPTFDPHCHRPLHGLERSPPHHLWPPTLGPLPPCSWSAITPLSAQESRSAAI